MRPKPKRKQSGAYLIRAKETDFCKIGVAVDIDKRLRQLQQANPHKLELLHVWKREVYCIPGVFPQPDKRFLRLEKALHDFVSSKRIHGEWFQLSNVEVEALIAYKPRLPYPSGIPESVPDSTPVCTPETAFCGTSVLLPAHVPP